MSDSADMQASSPPRKPNGAVERRALALRAGIVGLGTLLSRVLGLVREMVLAALFVRLQTDAFFLAFTIPNALRQLFAEGAVASAVVPVLTDTREKRGDEEARRFFQAIRGLSLLVLIIVSVLGVVFARPLCELFAAGYHDIPGQFERTVTVTRWVFPYILFMGTAALGMAALNTYRRFAVPAFSPALLNVAIVAAAVLLPTYLAVKGYDPTLALAFGALFGGLLQVLAQWPALRKIGYLRRPSLNLLHPGVREVVRRIIPMTFGLGVYYVDIVLSRRFLSELGVGAQSYFMWAMRLCDFPQGIFIMALSTASLPSLATLASFGERDEVSKTYAYGMRLAMFVAIPATILFVTLAHPIVVAFFQRGEFGAVAAHETARALVAQATGIWAVAAVRQIVPVYYAFGDTRTPVIVSAFDVVAFIALCLTLRGPFGHVGISWAVTGASLIQMVALWILLRRRIGNVRFAEVFGSMFRTLIASAVAGLCAWLVAGWIGLPEGAVWWRRVLPAALGATTFGTVFLLVAWIVRSPELMSLGGAVRRRLARKLSRS
ncbi:MAG: murein biosynthesis integral membrane protein MurJ [Myxococcota bacterium]